MCLAPLLFYTSSWRFTWFYRNLCKKMAPEVIIIIIITVVLYGTPSRLPTQKRSQPRLVKQNGLEGREERDGVKLSKSDSCGMLTMVVCILHHEIINRLALTECLSGWSIYWLTDLDWLTFIDWLSLTAFHWLALTEWLLFSYFNLLALTDWLLQGPHKSWNVLENHPCPGIQKCPGKLQLPWKSVLENG